MARGLASADGASRDVGVASGPVVHRETVPPFHERIGAMSLMKSPSRSYSEDTARALDPSVRGAELVVLAAHRDLGVRAAVASRLDAPMASLISLAHETDLRILSALVDNPTSPRWVIHQLAHERRSDIAERALARLRVMDAHAQTSA